MKRVTINYTVGLIILLIQANLYGQTSIETMGKWSLQFMVGVNNSRYYQFSLPYSKPVRSILSPSESISISYKMNNALALSIGLNHLSYGYSRVLNFTDYDGNSIGKSTIRWKHWTIQTPVQIAVKPASSLPLIVHFGGYLGFNYRNTAHSSNDDFHVKPSTELNRMDLGLLSGITYHWLNTKKFLIGNQISYYRGFSNLYYNRDFNIKAHGITFSVVSTIQL